MTVAMDDYILDDSLHLEYERLDLMSKILDPSTAATWTPSASARAGAASSSGEATAA